MLGKKVLGRTSVSHIRRSWFGCPAYHSLIGAKHCKHPTNNSDMSLVKHVLPPMGDFRARSTAQRSSLEVQLAVINKH